MLTRTTGVPAAAAVAGAQALLAGALAGADRPAGVIAAAVAALGWLLVLALRLPGAGVALLVDLGLAAMAALAGAPAWICAAAVGASVAAWDLTLLAVSAPPEAAPAQEARLVRVHLVALLAGLGPGVALVALLGRARVALPFRVVAVVALLALAALDRAWRRL